MMELLTHFCGKWYHLYMDNYYNSVALVKNLYRKKIRVYGTIRKNRGFPAELKNSKRNVFENAFQRKGEILAQLLRASKKEIIRMISSINNAALVGARKICRETNRKIQNLKCVLYKQIMKGVIRADQYLSY
jgi:hypothetical protein